MTIDIPDSVRQQTTKCPYDFGCLGTGHCGDVKICEVAYSYGGNVLSLVSNKQPRCPYHLDFGHGKLCTCPTRTYLHTKGRRSIG